MLRVKIASVLIGGLLLVVLCGVTIWKGLPLLLSGVVRLVPIAWEDRLGRAVVDGLARQGSACDDHETGAMMAAIVERLEQAMPKSSYRFDVRVVKRGEVNAMAAPGGHILVFSGLIERMDNPEQVAAVLAHEMQHVVQRHSMTSIVRSVGIQLVFSLVLGDPGVLGDLVSNLGMLSLMRSDEVSADDGAIETLIRAGISPKEMENAFANLAKVEGRGSSASAMKYLSTHPPLNERIARIRERSVAWKGQSRRFGFKLSTACKV